MTKAIMNALDLPVLEDLLKNPDNKMGADDEKIITDEMAEQYDANAELEEISTALSAGAVTHDVVEARRERDHENSTESIYREAMQHAKDLMDLGYNVDTRSAKGIFENAASMFKIALDAKNSKRDGHFKQQKLQIEKRKVDLIERQIKGAKDSDMEGEAVIVEDRNELIKRMREQAGKNNK